MRLGVPDTPPEDETGDSEHHGSGRPFPVLLCLVWVRVLHIWGGEALTLNRDGKQCLSSGSQSLQEKIKLPAPHKSVLLGKRKVNFFS